MIDIIIKLTEVINTNYRDKFVNELLTLQSVESLDNTVEETTNLRERIACLQKIISNFDINIQNAITEAAAMTTSNLAEEQKDSVNIFAATDKIIYSREWNRLAPIHKMIKIKEYFDFMPDSEFKAKLISEFETVINTKKMKDPEHIIYNNIIQKITSIPCLTINNDPDYSISFDL